MNYSARKEIALLACPFCQRGLRQVGAALKCESGHSFDMAKEGYVNLLVQKRVGDTKEMLKARRGFLESGLYAPLSDALNELVRAHVPDMVGPRYILDAGCGEGYYLDRLQCAFAARQDDCYIGLDVSKEAIRMAARRYPQLFFVVADVKQRLVLADSAFHVVLNIFAPRNPDEFARVIVRGGILIVVIPGPEHLLSLRAALGLLSIEEQKEQHVKEQFAGHFEFVTSSRVVYAMHLDREQVEQVVMMTPNYWHLTDEMREAMHEIEGIETEAGFSALVFRRT